MSVVPYTGVRDRSYGRSGGDLMSSDFSSKDRSSRRRSNLIDDFFGNSGDIFEDAFSSSRGLFGQMDRMIGSMMRDPFGDDPFFRGAPAFPSLMGPDTRRRNFEISPFGTMMSSMENMMREGNCHTFSSSSVMTMSTGPDGRPQAPLMMQNTEAKSYNWREMGSRATQVYQASSSSRGVPGGVRETQSTMADSRTGMRKMAIGHHINDRSHVIEKEMGRRGEVEEKQEFVNLDEGDADNFDREFKRKTQHAYGAIEARPRHRNTTSPSRQRSTYLPALPSSSYRRRTRPTLAITSGSRY